MLLDLYFISGINLPAINQAKRKQLMRDPTGFGFLSSSGVSSSDFSLKIQHICNTAGIFVPIKLTKCHM